MHEAAAAAYSTQHPIGCSDPGGSIGYTYVNSTYSLQCTVKMVFRVTYVTRTRFL
jgi:hypothetical protein